MALELQGVTRGLSRKRLPAFGAAVGLPSRAADRALEEVLAATEPMLDELADGALPLNPAGTRTLIRQLGRRRRDLLAP